MGQCGENRLSIRRLSYVALVAAAVAGAVIPPSAMAGDPIRMLVTFLGLVSASILPTVSLVIGSMSATGRSVQKIMLLSTELGNACHAMFSTLGWVAVTVFLLLLLTVVPEATWHWVIKGHPVQIEDMPRRAIQSLVLICSVSAVEQAFAIPKILLNVLGIKREIAIFEAQKNLREKAPSEDETRQMFKTREGFGGIVRIEVSGK